MITANIGQNVTLFNNIVWYFTISDNIRRYLTNFADNEQYLNVQYGHHLTIPNKVWKLPTILDKMWQYLTILIDILQYSAILGDT